MCFTQEYCPECVIELELNEIYAAQYEGFNLHCLECGFSTPCCDTEEEAIEKGAELISRIDRKAA